MLAALLVGKAPTAVVVTPELIGRRRKTRVLYPEYQAPLENILLGMGFIPAETIDDIWDDFKNSLLTLAKPKGPKKPKSFTNKRKTRSWTHWN